MSASNKVVWSEGMFLRPQHFQQHDRYVERYIDARCQAFSAHGWGVSELSIDHELLKLGKVSVSKVKGILPDGTPFQAPEIDSLPTPLDIPENVHDEIIYLAVPLRRAGSQQVLLKEQILASARYEISEFESRDDTSDISDTTVIEVGKLRMSLLRESSDRSGYACIGICKIAESRPDKLVILDEHYLPSSLDIRVLPQLIGFTSELLGSLMQRAEGLAGRLVDSGRAGSAEIADYLLLQLVNRLVPMVKHLNEMQGCHPESLFYELIQMSGELATFTTASKRSPNFPPYRHEQLLETFHPVIRSLRESLSMVFETTAVALDLLVKARGVRVSVIHDRSLLSTARFYIAAKAQMQENSIRSRLPDQLKIGPVEKIQQLVTTATSGIALRPLSVAPKQIPYHAGMTYFELDRHSVYWSEMAGSTAFAMHISGNFPGLDLEFWAVKE